MSVVQVVGCRSIDHIKPLAYALVAFFAISSIEASERLVQGLIRGIDSNEGVWVGIVTGEPSYDRNRWIPHEDFDSDETPETKKNWFFSQKGDFELKTSIEEEAVLLVIAKNRLPLEIPFHPGGEEQPIEATVSPGVSLEGSVRTRDGKPLVGATVSVAPGGETYQIPLFALPTWETAKDGSFRIGGLKERRHYTLAATASGYAPVILPAMRIPVDDTKGLEIALEDGYFVNGKAVAGDGESLAELKIVASWSRDALHVVESDGKLTVKGGRGWSSYDTGTTTNSDGSFRIGPFAKGTTGRLYADSASVGSAITPRISAPFDNLILRLDQETVRGRVMDETTGAPIEKFWVSMWVGESRPHTVESSDGVFDLPVYAIEADGTEITVSAQGYAPWELLMFEGASGDYDLGDIRLKRIRTIRGTVRDAVSGAPIKKAYIRGVMKRSYDPYKAPLGDNFTFNGIGQSDGSGAFTLDNVSPRVESLYVIAGRGKFASIDLPAEVEELDIELDFSGILEGSLIRPDRTPVEGVIELKGSSWWLPRIIKSDGSFRVEGLAPDTYTLKVETDAGLVDTRTVTIKAKERLTDLELVVQPGWTVSGTISGLEGIEYVEITARDSDARVLTRKVFRDGEYAIHGLPPEVTLVARSSSGHTLVREFLDGNAQDSTLDFHIEDVSRLTGWLTSGGQPLSGISLQIKPEDSSAVTTKVTTTESGRYEARRLADGRHVIHTDTGHTFDVNISGDTTFDFEVPQTSLSGFVSSERTRLPIGGGLVKLVRTDTPQRAHPIELSKRVGSDGTFLFEGLVTGEYDVLVEHPHAETASSRIRISAAETVDLMVQCATTSECLEGPLDASTLRGVH